MFIDKFLQYLLFRIFKICRSRISRYDSIDYLHTLSIIFTFLNPANTGQDIPKSFTLKVLFRKDLLYHVESKKRVLFIEISIFLNLFKEKVKAIESIFSTAFWFLEERWQKRFLLRIVGYSINSKIFYKFHSLFIIQRIFENFSVNRI